MFKKVLVLSLSFIFAILGGFATLEFYHFSNSATFIIAFFYCIPMSVIIDLLFVKNDKFIRTIVLPHMLGWSIPLTVALIIFPFASFITNFIFNALNITYTQAYTQITLKTYFETFLIIGSFLLTLAVISPRYKKIYYSFMNYFGENQFIEK